MKFNRLDKWVLRRFGRWTPLFNLAVGVALLAGWLAVIFLIAKATGATK